MFAAALINQGATVAVIKGVGCVVKVGNKVGRGEACGAGVGGRGKVANAAAVGSGCSFVA